MSELDAIDFFTGRHTRPKRAILTGVLTPGRLRKNEEYIATMSDRLIDRFIDRGRCEFVSNYAHALSTLVIADLLGVPEEDREQLLELLGKPPTQIGGDTQDKIAPDASPISSKRRCGQKAPPRRSTGSPGRRARLGGFPYRPARS